MQKTESFTPYQKFVVAVLTFLQFTVILDFMVLSPLGAVLMPALDMNTTQFGLVVSVYAFSAGASGLLASGFADRFDRKKMLLFFYAGFILAIFVGTVAVIAIKAGTSSAIVTGVVTVTVAGIAFGLWGAAVAVRESGHGPSSEDVGRASSPSATEVTVGEHR